LVYDDDWEFLDRSFGTQLGISAAIRQIIHLKCNELRARVQRRIDEPTQPVAPVVDETIDEEERAL